MVGGTDTDPKVQVILHYLGERNWLERDGAIIFSQYRTTAEWVLEALCATYPDEPVALYAGGVASFVQRGTDRRSAKREHIKESIQRGDVRLVCATDAACEGLNLQRLGAQINVDLPWNPSRLEQSVGRRCRGHKNVLGRGRVLRLCLTYLDRAKLEAVSSPGSPDITDGLVKALLTRFVRRRRRRECTTPGNVARLRLREV